MRTMTADIRSAEKNARRYIRDLYNAGVHVSESERGTAKLVWQGAVNEIVAAAESRGAVPFEPPTSEYSASKFGTIARFFIIKGGMSAEELADRTPSKAGSWKWTSMYYAAQHGKKNGLSPAESLAALERGELKGEKSAPKEKDALDVAFATYKAKGGDRDALMAYFVENTPA